MDNTPKIIKIKAKPSIRALGLSTLGIIFFGTFTFILLASAILYGIKIEGASYTAGIIIWYLFTSIPFSIFSACFWKFINLKSLVLKNESLIVKKPFLFTKKVISLNDFRKLNFAGYNVTGSYKKMSADLHVGEKTIIELKSGEIIIFNSFELSGYVKLRNELWKLCRVSKGKFNHDIDNKIYDIITYIILSLFLFLTFCFIYSSFFR